MAEEIDKVDNKYEMTSEVPAMKGSRLARSLLPPIARRFRRDHRLVYSE
jgi:hypothetical protein